MAKLLVSDTNSAIKLAFLEDKFFQDDFISIGAVGLWSNVVLSEVNNHILNPEKNLILSQLTFLRDCNYYYEFDFDEHEFGFYKRNEFAEAEESVRARGGRLGTSPKDQEVLYIALVNSCDLITNEYALADLSQEVIKHPDMGEFVDTKIYTAEDLVLCAYAEKKMTFPEVQDVLDRWLKAEEYVMSIKKSDFTCKGFNI
jgi:hypothetical protein